MSKWRSDAYIKRLLQNNRLAQGNCEYKLWEQEVEKTVDATPSIDIVFCKECKHYNFYRKQFSMERRGDGLCDRMNCVMKDDDFCSYGEREEE